MRKYRKINRKCTRLTAAVLCGAFIAVGIVRRVHFLLIFLYFLILYLF